jgi:TPR repeat protein
MYRENSLTVTKQNILLAVHLMALAASMGHVRAMTNLAHALFDIESWVGHYSRDQELLLRQHAHNLTSEGSPSVVSASENQTEVEVSMDGSGDVVSPDGVKDGKEENELQVQDEDDDLEEEENLLHRWGYNATTGIQIILSATSEIIRLPQPLRPDCSVALPLMKYMAEHTYRPNDLTKTGLAAYMEGDLWGALELYEEAADLGISIAQENTAFLYQLVSEKYCPSSSSSSPSSLWHKLQDSNFTQSFSQSYDRWKKTLEATFGSSSFFNWKSLDNEINSKLSDDLNRLKYRGYDKLLHHPSCSDYFHDMAMIRWIQVANSGDVEAIRELAQRYQGIDPSQSLGQVSAAVSTANRLTVNETKAALLYAIAASEHGDISSIMSLGWYVQNGKAGMCILFLSNSM